MINENTCTCMLKLMFLIDFLETIIREKSSHNRSYAEKQTTYMCMTVLEAVFIRKHNPNLCIQKEMSQN